jgi:hypothetical protein
LIRFTILILSFVLLSCTKTTLTEKVQTAEEFKTMMGKEKTYQITSYTDTLGNALPYDTNDRTIFEASTEPKNGRVYNEVSFTICFGYWAAYEHATLGYIVLEWIDFDLTPTYYRVLDYNVEQGWFVVKGNNMILKYELTR